MRALCAVLFVLVSSPASASFFDGNRVHDLCRTNRAVVIGYAAGLFDKSLVSEAALMRLYVEAISPSVAVKKLTPELDQSFADNLSAVGGYCTPKGIILDQITDILCQYLAANPAERQMSAEILFNRALSKAW